MRANTPFIHCLLCTPPKYLNTHILVLQLRTSSAVRPPARPECFLSCNPHHHISSKPSHVSTLWHAQLYPDGRCISLSCSMDIMNPVIDQSGIKEPAVPDVAGYKDNLIWTSAPSCILGKIVLDTLRSPDTGTYAFWTVQRSVEDDEWTGRWLKWSDVFDCSMNASRSSRVKWKPSLRPAPSIASTTRQVPDHAQPTTVFASSWRII